MMKRFPRLRGKTLEQLREIDWWHYLQEQGVTTDDIELLELFHSTDIGESTRHTAAANMIADYDQNGGDIAAAMRYRVAGGNFSLIQALAATLGAERIFLRFEVEKIRQHAGMVFLSAKDGRTAQAHYVICTLPTYALSKIHWNPVLTPVKKHAIESLPYARITKTSLLFKKRFWKDDNFEVVTDTLYHHIFHATQGQQGTAGILTSYATGDRASIINHMTDHQKIVTMCEALQVPFGSVRHLAVAVDSYCWSDNLYTQGAYAVFDSEDLKTQSLLSRPNGRVFMAGEHTAQFQGYMEGALESAVRCVKQITYHFK
jgi:monoamine oxidase